MAAYPSFDPRELVAVDKVWRHIEKDDDKTLVIFNAELCRLRNNYFPSLFYPEMARLSKELIPAIETVYYVRLESALPTLTLFTPSLALSPSLALCDHSFARCTISRVLGVASSSASIRVRGRCSYGYRTGRLCSFTSRIRDQASVRSVWTSFRTPYGTFSDEPGTRDCSGPSWSGRPAEEKRCFPQEFFFQPQLFISRSFRVLVTNGEGFVSPRECRDCRACRHWIPRCPGRNTPVAVQLGANLLLCGFKQRRAEGVLRTGCRRHPTLSAP